MSQLSSPYKGYQMSDPVIDSIILTKQNMAVDVLHVLRMMRDKCPNEWDSIMKTETGTEVCKLWDYLKTIA